MKTGNSQLKVMDYFNGFDLPVFWADFTERYKRQYGPRAGGLQNNLKYSMAVNKALVGFYEDLQAQSNYRISARVAYIDTGIPEITLAPQVDIWFDSPIAVTDLSTYKSSIIAQVLSDASGRGYSGVTANDIIFLGQADAKSFTNPARSLNSAFQISTTRDAAVSYSVDIATTSTLVGGQTGTVFLEYADDSGFTTNVKETGRFVNGNSVSLAIALTLNATNTAQVGGIIPAGKYVRIRTANTVGTPTFTFRSAQEVLL